MVLSLALSGIMKVAQIEEKDTVVMRYQKLYHGHRYYFTFGSKTYMVWILFLENIVMMRTVMTTIDVVGYLLIERKTLT